MAGIYSERLMNIRGTGPGNYVCPPGKRAAIKCITAMNGHTQAVGATLALQGVYVWYASVPAVSSVFFPGLTIVMYAGETLSYGANHAEFQVHVSGFLFDEPAAAAQQPVLPPEPFPEPTPPWELGDGAG